MLIETERLILRTFTEDDAADVLEYLREPAVHCFASMRLDSLDAAKDEMKQRKGDELYLAIVLKETGKVIGEIFAHPESNEPDDEIMDTFSPCWMLNLNYSGKGYAYEAAKAVVIADAAGVSLKDIQTIDYSWGRLDFEVRPMERMSADVQGDK